MVSSVLSTLNGAVVAGEGHSDIAISAVSNLTADPDMINEKSAGLALDVLVSATSKEDINPEAAKGAVGAISNIMCATHSTKEEQGEALHVQKKRNDKIMKLADQVLNSVVLDGEGVFEHKSPMLNATKKSVKPGRPFKASAGSRGGLTVSADALSDILSMHSSQRRLASTANLSVTIASFNVNTYATDTRVNPASGTSAISLKDGRNTIPVSNSDVVVSLQIFSGENTLDDLQCSFWDPQSGSPSGEGCTKLTFDRGMLSCQCTHMTDFFSTVATQAVGTIASTFQDANWDLFGVQA